MKKIAKIINVPEIEKQIKSKHKKFLKDVGIFSHKISEDHQLLLTRLVARMTRVIECFIEAKIIDECSPYNMPYVDSEYIRCFRLRKKEFTESVYIWTDGRVIAMEGNSPLKSNQEIIRNVDLDDFDGVSFCDILLNYIHSTIYSRKESYNQKFFSTDVVEKEDNRG